MNLETLYDSTCDVYKAVESVTGLPASSASLTDTYVLNCKPGVTFGSKPVEKMFVKLSVSVTSLTRDTLELLKPYLPERDGMTSVDLLFKRLAYAQMEANVYEIVKKIYYSHMCPFFVRVYGVGFDCTYQQLRKLLKSSKHNLKRNIWYSLTDVSRRPAIHIDTVEENTTFNNLDTRSLRYHLLLLQYVDHPSVLDLMVQGHYNDLQQLLQLTFMVGYACYALYLYNLCHRDLHLRNVLVERCDESRTVVLVVDETAYKLDITEFPRLFDFDRSKEQPCPTSAQDLFYFVGFFAALLEPDTQTKLAGCFVDTSNPFRRTVPRLLSYWKQPVQERRSEDTHYLLRQLEPLPKVLSRLAQLANLEVIDSTDMYKDVFIARRDLVSL